MTNTLKEHIAFGPRTEARAESVSELFHENSRMIPATLDPTKFVGDFTLTEAQAVSRAYKQYRLYPRFPLPEIGGLPAIEIPFDHVMVTRRSRHDFANAEVEFHELSRILYYSFGVTAQNTIEAGISHGLRAAPSAGGLYPAEIYLGIRQVTGVMPGIYHYNVPEHALEQLSAGDPTEVLYRVTAYQEDARRAGVVMLIAGILPRTKGKYGERGYRYVLMDIGHLGENIYLACTALQLAIRTGGGFFDDEANDLLGLDGLNEVVLYLAFIGKPESA